MENQDSQFKTEIDTRLQEDWGISDSDARAAILEWVFKNINTLNTRLTQTLRTEDWSKMQDLAETLCTFAENIDNSRLKKISSQMLEASRSKDSLQGLATSEEFHRLLRK